MPLSAEDVLLIIKLRGRLWLWVFSNVGPGNVAINLAGFTHPFILAFVLLFLYGFFPKLYGF